ncbi:MAG: hypothetical protein HYV97_06655 [Bdellovibrio sp.]|nr:hypothetical protein [Bdellovibrio sp.]
MRLLVIVLFFCQISIAVAAEATRPVKINYQYKKYEHFDLGDLEVQGNLVAPGDLSVKEQGAHLMDRKLFIRANFDGEMRRDILDLR